SRAVGKRISQLLATAAAVKVEPPYTAPLAPFDMELVKRVGLKGKLVASDSVWGDGPKRNNPDVDETRRFMNLERGDDADDTKPRMSSSESLSLLEKRAKFAERVTF
ncbi:hypothetical protein ACLKA7_000920, partial [Drosophila subpalustris]